MSFLIILIIKYISIIMEFADNGFILKNPISKSLMYQKLQKKDFFTHKQALPITPGTKIFIISN